MRIDGNTILVTGAAGGIGRALAHRLHDLGNHVIVAGRRPDELEKAIAGRVRMSALALDVSDPASVAACAAKVTGEHPSLNVLVNNAGVTKFEDLTTRRDLGDAEASIATNLLGPIRMIDALVEHLSGKLHSAIVNVSSGAAFVPVTATPTYCATKAAIHSYTVSLRERLPRNVEVIEIVPPGVRTELVPGQLERSEYMPLDDFIDEIVALLARDPTPTELLVERVKPERYAERENRFDVMLRQVNDLAPEART